MVCDPGIGMYLIHVSLIGNYMCSKINRIKGIVTCETNWCTQNTVYEVVQWPLFYIYLLDSPYKKVSGIYKIFRYPLYFVRRNDIPLTTIIHTLARRQWWLPYQDIGSMLCWFWHLVLREVSTYLYVLWLSFLWINI